MEKHDVPALTSGRQMSLIFEPRRMDGMTADSLPPCWDCQRQVFGRYEVAVSKLHVTRLVHLCEVLDMICQAAPNLFGKSQEKAGLRAEAIAAVQDLPEDTLTLRDVVCAGGSPAETATP